MYVEVDFQSSKLPAKSASEYVMNLEVGFFKCESHERLYALSIEATFLQLSKKLSLAYA